MSESDDVRQWSSEELREYILSGSAEDWAEIRRMFTRDELEELREILFPPPPPPVPTAEQAAALISKIAATTNEQWLRRLREKAAGWDISIRGAIDARLALLHLPALPRPHHVPEDRGWVSPEVDRASPGRPPQSNGAAPSPSSAGSDSGGGGGRACRGAPIHGWRGDPDLRTCLCRHV